MDPSSAAAGFAWTAPMRANESALQNSVEPAIGRASSRWHTWGEADLRLRRACGADSPAGSIDQGKAKVVNQKGAIV